MPIVVPDAVDILTVDEVLVFFPSANRDQVAALIEGAVARAVLVAPCLGEPEFTNYAALKGIIRDAVLRRVEGSTGVLATQTAGPFGQSFDTRTSPRALFFPSEIHELQALCAAQAGDTVGEEPRPVFNFPPACPTDRAPGTAKASRIYVW